MKLPEILNELEKLQREGHGWRDVYGSDNYHYNPCVSVQKSDEYLLFELSDDFPSTAITLDSAVAELRRIINNEGDNLVPCCYGQSFYDIHGVRFDNDNDEDGYSSPIHIYSNEMYTPY